MRALTICQPYASLICLPDDDDRAKRVENRTWPTSYRGPLLIHAGKSKQWLRFGTFGLVESDLVYGAIVGIANLADCTSVVGAEWESAVRRRPWLASHEHVSGPFCFVLTECRRFETPIPYRGAQGFFEIPPGVVASQLEASHV